MIIKWSSTLLSPVLALCACGLGFAQIQSAGTLFVDLRATDPSATTPAWVNAGSLGGTFARTGTPTVSALGPNGNLGMNYNGTTDFHRGAAAPAGLTGAGAGGTRSVEVWAFNPAIAGEETLVSLAKRGGPNGSNISFNYGSNADFGAVGHWAGSDIGWDQTPAAGTWHHLVYTFDGTTTRVYEGGTLKNSENSTTANGGALDAHDGVFMQIASQMEPDGTTATGAVRGSLGVAQVRVHDGVLTSSQIANNYNVDATSFGLVSKLPSAPGNPIGEWNFSRDSLSSLAVANGAALAAFATGIDAANLRDDASGNARGSTWETPHYRSYNVSELGAFSHIDGKALATGGAGVGEGYVWFNGESALATNDTFSIWGRVKMESNLGGDQFIFSRPGNWDLRVDGDGDLLTSFGGVTTDTGHDVKLNEWLDVGLTYAGLGAAGNNLVEVFVDGSSVGTFNAGAFGTGDWLHIGAGPGGGNDFDGLFDRVAFWDNVVSDSVFAELSLQTPEPTSVAIWTVLGALGLCVAWRKLRK